MWNQIVSNPKQKRPWILTRALKKSFKIKGIVVYESALRHLEYAKEKEAVFY
jgi:hypothetical protein